MTSRAPWWKVWWWACMLMAWLTLIVGQQIAALMIAPDWFLGKPILLMQCCCGWGASPPADLGDGEPDGGPWTHNWSHLGFNTFVRVNPVGQIEAVAE